MKKRSYSDSLCKLILSRSGKSVSGGSARPIAVLSRNILPGERITITHKPSGSSVCLGFLPGDVDQSGMVASADILEMVDIINGVKRVPLYIGDIDRSGVIAPADQLAFTDILNSSNGKTLPACPAL